MLPSPSSTVTVLVFARFGFGVGSGVWSCWAPLGVEASSCWWPRFPSTELRVTRALDMVGDEEGRRCWYWRRGGVGGETATRCTYPIYMIFGLRWAIKRQRVASARGDAFNSRDARQEHDRVSLIIDCARTPSPASLATVLTTTSSWFCCRSQTQRPSGAWLLLLGAPRLLTIQGRSAGAFISSICIANKDHGRDPWHIMTNHEPLSPPSQRLVTAWT